MPRSVLKMFQTSASTSFFSSDLDGQPFVTQQLMYSQITCSCSRKVPQPQSIRDSVSSSRRVGMISVCTSGFVRGDGSSSFLPFPPPPPRLISTREHPQIGVEATQQADARGSGLQRGEVGRCGGFRLSRLLPPCALLVLRPRLTGFAARNLSFKTAVKKWRA